MHTKTPASRPSRERRSDRHVSMVWCGALLGATLACHDAPAAPAAPTSPSRNVSSDGTWIVNSLADPGDGECTNSECTLREAIAASESGDRITFKGNLTGTIALTAGFLNIDKSVTIEARSPEVITVNGQGASTVFVISGVDVLVTLSGLKITGGSAFDGGGIYVTSTLNLIGSVVTGNSANYGGGINAHGSLRLIGSTVGANIATTGAGGGIYAKGSLLVSRSTVSGNTAEQEGGGISHECTTFDCPISISSSTITQNSAPSGGGLNVLFADPVTIANTIIAGNRLSGSLIGTTADCNSSIGGLVDIGYNLTSAGTGCAFTHPTDVIVPFSSQVFVSVLYPVLAENGSPRPTHALVERGRAVDVGYCPGESGDQRGFPRPYDDVRMPNALDGCDIGAFEWQPADTKTKGPKP